MSKLNPATKGRTSVSHSVAKATSHNGNPQFKKELHQELFELAVGFIYGRDAYYEKSDARLTKLGTLIEKIVKQDGDVGARFIADTALFTREVGGLRTAPIIIMTELAKVTRKLGLTPESFSLRHYLSECIQRVDELTDGYAYALRVFGDKGSVPLSIKKGVADAFNKFDAYQFGKYDRDGDLKLRDLLRIVHAKPVDAEHARIFNGLVNGTLEAPLTHEVVFSRNGQLPKSERRADADIWLEFLRLDKSETGSLGVMAIIRNLRRMAQANLSPEGWSLVTERLRSASDREVSKLLAFNLINSYTFAKSSGVPGSVLTALSQLIDRSFGSLPKLGERVLIILDTSGSMNEHIAVPKGQKLDLNRPSMAAALFSAALLKQAAVQGSEARLIRFSTSAEELNFNLSDSVSTIYEQIMSHVQGGGTNLESALELYRASGYKPDVVFLMSDMQVDVFTGSRQHTVWGQNAVAKPLSKSSRTWFGQECRKVAFNFNAYESTPVGEHDGWFQLSGWSSNVFKYLTLSEHVGSMAQAVYALGPGAWRESAK